MCDVRRREEEEKEPGIQNQKQEPHTKLWGTNLPPATYRTNVFFQSSMLMAGIQR